MRWLGLLGLLAVGACAANQPTNTVWEKPDGTIVGQREMRSAILACGSEMADRVYGQQTPYPVGSEPWVQENFQIQASPAYGLMSKPELNTCLASLGYIRAAAPVGEGSSLPPAALPAQEIVPRITQPPGPLTDAPTGW